MSGRGVPANAEYASIHMGWAGRPVIDAESEKKKREKRIERIKEEIKEKEINTQHFRDKEIIFFFRPLKTHQTLIYIIEGKPFIICKKLMN